MLLIKHLTDKSMFALKGSQSMVPTSAPSGNFLEIRTLENHCRSTATEIQRVEASTLLDKPARASRRRVT